MVEAGSMAPMRTFAGLVTVVPLLFTSLAATPLDALNELDGHWHCTVVGGRPADRSYYVVATSLGPNAGRREAFGRQDTTQTDGTPVTSFERIAENAAGGVAVEAVEGQGTGAKDAASLRFAGRSFDDASTFELAYSVTGDTLRRNAKNGATTVDDETCTREPQAPPVANCPRPDVPAKTVRVVEPDTPAEAFAARAKGLVQVRVVLDDRSRVLWADVLKSASPLLSAVSVQAARAATYQTAIVACRPVPAEYVFTVDFE